MGVRKAMDKVLDASDKKKNDEVTTVFTEGPLIHNPQVLDMLENKGIKALKEENDISKSTIVIRAHGITPKRRQELTQSGANICDATCPRVTSVQTIIEKHANEGYSTVIVGDEGHAEVVGLLGYANGNGYVISSAEEVSHLPDMDKICIVAQTTQDIQTYSSAVAKLKERYKTHKIFETICSSTSRRQEEIVKLSNSVDAMIVVGGRGSANTNRLVQISANEGTPTFLVETEKELERDKLIEFEKIGVTAGASTPNWLIQQVVEKVQAFHAEKVSTIRMLTKKTEKIFIGSFMHLAFSAASLSYTGSVLLGIRSKFSFCTIASLCIFSMYVLNHFAYKEAVELNVPSRAKLYNRHQILFMVLGVMAAIASITLGFILSIQVFFCVFFTTFFGIVYKMSIIPKNFHKIVKYRSLEQIPGSKEIFISMAWAVSTGLIPFLGAPVRYSPALPVVLVFIFSIAFIRTTLLGVNDVHGDMLVGKETIPIAIGKTRTKQLLIAISVLLAILLIVSPITGLSSNLSFYLLPCVIYACGYLYLFHKRLIPSGLTCELITDFNFILAGIMVIIWRLCE